MLTSKFYRCPMSKAFTAEFNIEAAKLGLEHNYTHSKAA